MRKLLLIVTACVFFMSTMTACSDNHDSRVWNNNNNFFVENNNNLFEVNNNLELQPELVVTFGFGFYSAELESPEQLMIYQKLNEFKNNHPDIIVTHESVLYFPGGTFPSDPFPDVIELAPHQTRWVADGELELLNSIVDMIGWSGEYADLIERTSINGNVWILPVTAEPLVIYYDEEVFQRLHIPLPHDDWTWEAFVDATIQLDANSYNISIPDNFEIYEPIIKGLGGSYHSPDGSVFTGYMDSEATISAFEQVVAAIGDPRAHSAQRENRPVALGIGWPSSLFLTLDRNEHMRIARMPVFPDGNRYNTMFTTGLSISSASKMKATALDLLKTVVDANDEEAIRFVNYHTLTVREGRFMVRPPAQTEQLLDIMRLETRVATPSPFQLHTHTHGYMGLLAWNHDDVLLSFPQIFEEGTAEPVLKQLADVIDNLYPSMKGNWRGR